MAHIDQLKFGSITVNGKKYHQVLIIGDKVIERDREKLEQEFGTTHYIGDWEVNLLLSNNPQLIIIGNGFSGVLEVTPEVKNKIEKQATLKILLSPQAIDEYNRQVEKNILVNALIHTTC